MDPPSLVVHGKAKEGQVSEAAKTPEGTFQGHVISKEDESLSSSIPGSSLSPPPPHSAESLTPANTDSLFDSSDSVVNGAGLTAGAAVQAELTPSTTGVTYIQPDKFEINGRMYRVTTLVVDGRNYDMAEIVRRYNTNPRDPSVSALEQTFEVIRRSLNAVQKVDNQFSNQLRTGPPLTLSVSHDRGITLTNSSPRGSVIFQSSEEEGKRINIGEVLKGFKTIQAGIVPEITTVAQSRSQHSSVRQTQVSQTEGRRARTEDEVEETREGEGEAEAAEETSIRNEGDSKEQEEKEVEEGRGVSSSPHSSRSLTDQEEPVEYNRQSHEERS